MPSSRPAVYTVRSLEQARILADPLRLSILREFVEGPRTTMQVAGQLGENAPKLYRHVQALLDAGLLERKGEKKKRGTTERYLQAVAARFEVDAALFSPAGRGTKGNVEHRQLARMIRALFASTQSELLSWCANPTSDTDPPTVARMLVRGSRTEVERIRRRIIAIIEGGGSKSRSRRKVTDELTLTGLIAFHVSKTRGKR